MNSTKRKDWVDALRGISMIMILLVHLIPADGKIWPLYNMLVGPIMIPMFFSVSGYVFNGRNGNQKAFFKNLFRKLVVPSLILIMGSRFLLIPFWGISQFFSTFVNLLSGESYWYISAWIVADIIFFYILKLCKKPPLVCLTACVCCAVGLLMDKLGIGDYAMINRGFIAQFFLLIGYLFRIYESSFKCLNWPVVIAGGLLYLAMSVVSFIIWPGESIDVHLNRYYNVAYCFVLIFVGILFLMTAASKIEKAHKLLALIGRHTLTIYALNGYFLMIGMHLLPMDASSESILVLKAVLIAAFSAFICTGIGIVLNKLCPEAMGRSRER